MKETDHQTCPFRQSNEICTSKIRLFKPFPEKAQEALVANAVHSNYKKGAVLSMEGDTIDAVLIIRKGRVKTCRYDAAGEEYIMDILHDGQAIWHDMFLQDHVYHYNIVALTDIELCEIARKDFMEMLGQYPDCAMYLISMLSTELKEAKEKSVLLSIRQPLVRLAGFLLMKEQTCTHNMIKMKLDDIASSICLRPETVSRCMKTLTEEKMIARLGQGKIKVINHAALLDLFQSLKDS